jgi:hypothetical protein
MVRKRIKKPEPVPEAINKSAHPLKRRKPIRMFSTHDKETHKFIRKNEFLHVKGDVVRDKEGYIWVHEMTADDEQSARTIGYLLKRKGKDHKIVKNGSVFEIFTRKE